jgi:hypothetical protein
VKENQQIIVHHTLEEYAWENQPVLKTYKKMTDLSHEPAIDNYFTSFPHLPSPKIKRGTAYTIERLTTRCRPVGAWNFAYRFTPWPAACAPLSSLLLSPTCHACRELNSSTAEYMFGKAPGLRLLLLRLQVKLHQTLC